MTCLFSQIVRKLLGRFFVLKGAVSKAQFFAQICLGYGMTLPRWKNLVPN